jgi:hypothetical protein
MLERLAAINAQRGELSQSMANLANSKWDKDGKVDEGSAKQKMVNGKPKMAADIDGSARKAYRDPSKKELESFFAKDGKHGLRARNHDDYVKDIGDAQASREKAYGHLAGACDAVAIASCILAPGVAQVALPSAVKASVATGKGALFAGQCTLYAAKEGVTYATTHPYETATILTGFVNGVVEGMAGNMSTAGMSSNPNAEALGFFLGALIQSNE